MWKKESQTTKNETPFTRMGNFFSEKWKISLLLWIAILFSGTLIYTSLIKREGFPSIQFPLTVVNGTYFVDDAEQVDRDIAQPVYQALKDTSEVDQVNTSAGDNFFSTFIVFNDTVTPEEGTDLVKDAIARTNIPTEANLSFTTIDPASFLNKYDLLLSVYQKDGTSTHELQDQAYRITALFGEDEDITTAEVQDLITTGVNPLTGESQTRQTAFSSIGLREDGEIQFYPSITIGIDGSDELDVIELSALVNEQVSTINQELADTGNQFAVTVAADFAEGIDTQITSLQNNLLTGLLAVAIVSLLLITWRASIITGLFMFTVMSTTIVVLYLLGYSLNTITLFGLVLSLGLFVDDATIVVEAIDATRRKSAKRREIITNAVRSVAGASFAGTMTTVLVFAPLAFISGILGEFIRLIPITVIVSLLSSLILSLTLIPFLSRFILLFGKKQKLTVINRLEEKIANRTAKNILLLRTNRRKGILVGVSALALSGIFFIAALGFASRLPFNIFPPSKDSDQIGYEINSPAGYSLEQAQQLTVRANQIVKDTLGDNISRVTYGSFTQPNERNADAFVELVPFNTREEKSPDLVEELQQAFDEQITDGTRIRVIQYDAGPPAEEFPLRIQVFDEDVERINSLATEIEQYIQDAELERQNGTTAMISEARYEISSSVQRVDGKRYGEVLGAFSADDTSALLELAETYVSDKFNAEYLREAGYSENSLGFDFGQESENAESFQSLGIIFVVAIVLMYTLLAIQFRSLLQPLLIFMAIPFSLFGVFLGLYATDNALSFFVQVGLIGLIGIAVNNTILMTDYANQERREGKRAIEAVADAARRRFRPLITTSLTTVVALLPLAITEPFWEPLALTIAFGLLSSTFLVVIAFPYYYLISEWLRSKVSRSTAMVYIIVLSGVAVIASLSGLNPILAVAITISLIIAQRVYRVVKSKRSR